MTDTDIKTDRSARYALERRLRNFQVGINTAMPGTLVAVDGNRVRVRLDCLREFNGEPADAIEVPDVPVLYPGSSRARLSWPLSAGDTGLVLWCQRDADRWLDGQGPTLPATLRLHDLSDAVFLAGLAPFDVAPPVPDRVTLESGPVRLVLDDTGTAELDTGAGSLTIDPDGRVTLVGSGGTLDIGTDGRVVLGGGPGENLTALLAELVTVLAATTVLPHKEYSPADLSTKAQLQLLVARFNSIVGAP